MKPLLQLARTVGQRCEALVPFVPVLLRLAVGATMVVHGWGKLQAPDLGMVATKLVGGLGLPESLSLLGYLAVFGEFIGGVGLLLGLLTRPMALWVAGVMLGATYSHAIVRSQAFKQTVIDGSNAGWEWQLLLVMAAITLVVLGGGKLSLDHILWNALGGGAPDESSAID